MKFKSLPRLEEDIRTTGNNGEYRFQKIAFPVPGEDLVLEGLFTQPVKRSGYYHQVAHPKNRIVIHYTAGQLRSDLSVLTRDDFHVCVAFVIAGDGTIYQLHPSKFWSGHLGKGLGNTGTRNAEDKCTIGIELSNYGFLIEREGNLETVYSRQKDKAGKSGAIDIYCSLTETEAFTKLASPFRGQSSFASYPETQYTSLIILLRYLTAEFNIPRKFLDPEDRFITTDKVLDFKGIVSHINYRVDGKWDIGQAFDWDKVINGVQAPAFAATAQNLSAAGTDGQEPIRSEKDLEKLIPAERSIQTETASMHDIDFSENEMVENTGAKPKLFALIIGINDYDAELKLDQEKVSFPRLRGCVNDAGKIKAMLEQDDYFEKNILLITDKEATKPAIAKAFRDHLGKAGKNDVALFYFSGHGTQEWADTDVFTSETDGKMEALACYYDKDSIDNFLLADKELRFLIHEISKSNPHTVTIFDCCHSADTTRNAEYVNNAFPKIVEKRVTYTFPKRNWDKFIFHKELKRDDFISKGESKVLPEGRHLQLSACESDESAVESSGEGVFTKILLRVLEASAGEITYYALRNRVRQYLRNVFEQKPRIYVAFNDESLLYSAFLNKPFNLVKNAFAEVTYNKGAGWQVNMGAIHGLGSKIQNLKVIDVDDPGKVFNAKLKLVKTDSAELNVEGDLDKAKVYKAHIEGLMSNTLQVHIKQEEGDGNARLTLMDTLFKEAGKFLVAEDEEEKSQYVLRTLNGKHYITLPNDPFRPLTELVRADDPSASQKLVATLQHIASWEFIHNLSNEDSSTKLPPDTLKIEISEVDDNGKVKPISLNKNVARIEYHKTTAGWENKIRIKLTNGSDKKVYVAALYLTSGFESFNGLLNPTVYPLANGESVDLNVNGDPVLPVLFDEVMKWYNKEKLTDYLKFIVSTEEFDTNALTLEKLPPPPIPSEANRGVEEKGIGITKPVNRNIFGWNVQELVLEMINPEPGVLNEPDLGLMIHNDETGDFAKRLYGQKANGGGRMKEEMAGPAKEEREEVSRGRKTRGFTRSKPPGSGGAGASDEVAPVVEPPQDQSFAKKNGHGKPKAPPKLDDLEETLDDKPTEKKKRSAKKTKEASFTREGQLDYEIPGKMEVQKSSDCKVQIAGREVSAAALKISEISTHADITIGNEMSVRLIDGSGGQFNITEISTARQAIIPKEITKWVFRVFPKQAGRYPLILKVTMHANGVDKDIDVLEKEILVNAGDAAPAAGDSVKRILFLAANPANEARLRVGAEHDRIGEELTSSGKRDQFLFSSLMAVTTQSISRSILAENPYIIHFSGHGKKEGIYLETDAGLSKLVTAKALKLLFASAAKGVQCVLLNACYSAEQAKSIAETVPFVIGMMNTIKDGAALDFATGFYQAIGAGKSIQDAYDIGVAAMALNSGGEEIPVLLKK